MDVPLSDHMEQFSRLIDLYGIPPDRRAGWLNEMAETFDAYPVEAVERAVNQYRKDYAPPPGAYVQVPPPGTFAEWVYRATDELDAAALDRALALPSPAARSDAGTTPDERRRWALEDAEIRPWYAAILRRRAEVAWLNDRLDPETREWQRGVEAVEDLRGTVPDMAPEERRARERRIEVAKEAARAVAKRAGLGRVIPG